MNKSDAYIDHACGKPLSDMEMKILKSNQEIVSVYIRGELNVRTKAMFARYYNDPEKREVLAEDEWYKTDNIAFMKKNGTFYIEGLNKRQKDCPWKQKKHYR